MLIKVYGRLIKINIPINLVTKKQRTVHIIIKQLFAYMDFICHCNYTAV